MVAVSLADLKSSIGQAMLGDTETTSAAGRAAFGNTSAAPKVAADPVTFGDTGTMPKSGGAYTLRNTGTTNTPDPGQAALGPMRKSGVGRALLGDLGTISAAEARIHACDCKLIPAVLGSKSELLDLGRQHRLISTPLRRALYLRDRGCAFPGCRRPPRHCQGHHIRHWADGGPTELGNLVLMCAHHHRLLHRSGWQVRIAADGLPEFLPPVFLDKRRKPRRNNLHQPLPFAA
jgi:hypothetical protein